MLGELQNVDGRYQLRFRRALPHPPEVGKAARDAAGWHACLDILGHHLAGEKPPWSPRRALGPGPCAVRRAPRPGGLDHRPSRVRPPYIGGSGTGE